MSACGTKKAQSTTQICIKIISQDLRFVLHRIHRCLNCNSELAWCRFVTPDYCSRCRSSSAAASPLLSSSLKKRIAAIIIPSDAVLR
eukprot:scaffold1645_cov102-Skeletonema_dohrnii-CCMP3373.AAC.2